MRDVTPCKRGRSDGGKGKRKEGRREPVRYVRFAAVYMVGGGIVWSITRTSNEKEEEAARQRKPETRERVWYGITGNTSATLSNFISDI